MADVMLANAIALLGKLKDWVDCHRDSRTRQPDRLVTTIYADLKRVHQDYLRLFEDAIEQLLTREMADVVVALKRRQLSEEAERQAILSHVEVLREVQELKALRPFFAAVVEYFCNTPLSGNGTPSSALLGRLRHPHITLHGADPRTSTADAVAWALESLRDHFKVVSLEYARTLSVGVE